MRMYRAVEIPAGSIAIMTLLARAPIEFTPGMIVGAVMIMFYDVITVILTYIGLLNGSTQIRRMQFFPLLSDNRTYIDCCLLLAPRAQTYAARTDHNRFKLRKSYP